MARSADDHRAEVLRLASEGAAAYNDGNYAQAAERFQAAYDLYPAAKLLLNISRAELGLGRCAKALQHAQGYKAAAPSQAKDSPDVWLATVLRSCKEAEISSTPAATSLWIDGEKQRLDKTPWVGWLTIGTHKIVLARVGFQDQSAFFEVTAGRPAKLSLTLLPVPDLDLDASSAALPSPVQPTTPPPATPPVAAIQPLIIPISPTPPPAVVQAPPPAVVRAPPPAVVQAPPPAVVQAPPPAVVQAPPPAVVQAPPPAVVVQAPPAATSMSPRSEAASPQPPPASAVNLNATSSPSTALPPGATEGQAPHRGLSRGRIIGIAAIATGSVALAVATALGVTARNDALAAQTMPPTGSVAAQLSSINGRTYGADALFGVGGVLASVGIALTAALQ